MALIREVFDVQYYICMCYNIPNRAKSSDTAISYYQKHIRTTDQVCTCVVVGIEIRLNFKTHLC